jgi:dUTP pyrophosphatase
MKLNVLKLTEDAIIPQYAHPDDAGMDLFSIDSITIKPGQIVLIHTGIAIELPNNMEAQIRPRSGLALKNGITLLNSPGTIDAGYRGEIGVILINHGREDFEVKKGARIAQMVIKPIIHVDIEAVNHLQDSARGSGGFGSSGM